MQTARIQGPIKSENPDAIELLQIKIEDAQEYQRQMKAANAAYKKMDKSSTTVSEMRQMLEESVPMESDSERAYCMKQICTGQRPYPAYRLTNNNAKIKSAERRLADLRKVLNTTKTEPVELVESAPEMEGVNVEESLDDMRIRIFFPGKPSDAIREILKRNGMRWSPNAGAWQRKLTLNGKSAVYNWIIPAIKKELSE